MREIDIADSGRKFQEQAAGLMDLLARVQRGLAACVGQGVDEAKLAALVEQQAALAATAEQMLRTHEEVAERLGAHDAELASREAALAASRSEPRALTHGPVQVQGEERRATAPDHEESLRHTEAIYRAIARSFPGAAIYVFDHDLRYQVVEGEGLALFGHTSEQMEGKTIWDVLDPETVVLIEPRYRRVLAGESLYFETRFGPQYGHKIVAAQYRPIWGDDGQVKAGLLVARDLSERSHLLAKLESHISELDAILAALPSGLIVYDREGKVTRINDLAKSMLAYGDESWQRPVGERITRSVQLSRLDGTLLDRAEYPAIRALQGEQVRNESYFVHLPAHPEKDFWAVINARPLVGPAGEHLGAALTMTDVTALHEARARLQDANEELRRQATILQQQANALLEAKEQLEQRVEERTGELAVLLKRMEVKRAQLRALSRRLVEMQESERSYVADQLYNQAAQVLAAVRMQVWLLEKHQGETEPGDALAGMKDALDQTILALHDLATQLRPAGLDRATLSRVVGEYVGRYLGAHGIGLRLDVGNTADLRVSNEVVTAVFRTIQEAVSNIAQHAQANEATLTMQRDGETLVITLADDGVGFDPDDEAANEGVGLIAMRERIQSVGGRLTLESGPAGTSVRIEVPVI